MEALPVPPAELMNFARVSRSNNCSEATRRRLSEIAWPHSWRRHKVLPLMYAAVDRKEKPHDQHHRARSSARFERKPAPDLSRGGLRFACKKRVRKTSQPTGGKARQE